MDVVMDWYCETYRCKMTRAACELRRKRAASTKNGPYGSERQLFNDAGCHSCSQRETRKITENMDVQECRKCHEIKPVTEYYSSKGKPENTCKKCRYEQEKVWKIKKGIITGKEKEDYRTRVGDEPVKECKSCHEILPLRAFFTSKTNADGREGKCRQCKHRIMRGIPVKKNAKEKPKTVNALVEDRPLKIKAVVVDHQEPICEPKDDLRLTKEPQMNQKIIEVDFSEHPDLYEKLMDISKNEFRPIGMQALYFLAQQVKEATA